MTHRSSPITLWPFLCLAITLAGCTGGGGSSAGSTGAASSSGASNSAATSTGVGTTTGAQASAPGQTTGRIFAPAGAPSGSFTVTIVWPPGPPPVTLQIPTLSMAIQVLVTRGTNTLELTCIARTTETTVTRTFNGIDTGALTLDAKAWSASMSHGSCEWSVLGHQFRKLSTDHCRGRFKMA